MIYNEAELKREILILQEIVKAQTIYITNFKSRTCSNCEWDNDCDIKWKITENARDSVKSKYCSLWEQK